MKARSKLEAIDNGRGYIDQPHDGMLGKHMTPTVFAPLAVTDDTIVI